jgi:D-alanyl-D-alanine carboxypeptidase/D-alanyl-D-alanine-endopeptidase (penicillin-binding protein 4)
VDLFGPQYVFGGQLWSEGPPDKSGRVTGNVYLCGCANPDGSQSVIWPLAKALADKGVKVIAGDVVSTGPLAAGDRDHGLKSAQRLGAVLAQVGIHVQGKPREGFCPRAPVELASCHSVSLAEYLRQTNKSSENREAQCMLDAMLASYSDPTDPDPDFLLRYWSLQGLDTSGLHLDDGSGYSRDSRLSPAFLDAVLLRMAALPAEYEVLSHSFPTAGVDGTLQSRMQGTAAEGRVRAKTGTLTGVSCLSGYVERGGKPRLVFSLLINGFSSLSAARHAEDQVAVVLAEWAQEQS